MVPRELESAELTAEASSLPMNAEVSSTSVEVRVLPREYVLSFSPSALSVIVAGRRVPRRCPWRAPTGCFPRSR